MKMNLVIMFGGVSCEHDISIITAMQAIKHINKEKYNIIPIYITKSGEWYSGKQLLDISFFTQNMPLNKLKKVTILPNSSNLYAFGKFGLKKLLQIDVAILAFHGINGEDGAIPALFQLNLIPYSAPSLVGSSLAIDKVNFKYFIKGLGLESVKFLTYSEFDFKDSQNQIVKEIEKKLDYPVIVKPSKLGSSIGINVCNNKKELIEAFELGFSLGEYVLVEEYLKDIKEVNCAVLGIGNDIIVSELEEPIKTSKILSFENKYINSGKSGDMEFINRKMPPDLSEDLYGKVVDISKKLFLQMGLKGVVRIDYIVKDEKVYVNEINTIPGSFANYLFRPKNITFEKLIDRVVSIAINETILNQQKIKTFNSDVLKNIDLNGNLKK